MIKILPSLTPQTLRPRAQRVFELSARKLHALQKNWDPDQGSPVYTVAGRYMARGWTEWTQGFQFGSEILQFDATGEVGMLASGRENTRRYMAAHVSHVGVHDHGFNNISTYGNLHRLAREGKISADQGEMDFYELALKASGAVQAARWTDLPEDLGFIYSFNGPHSLFSDTIRSLRVLAVAHQLGHSLMGERDRKISLLGRLLQHAETTARYNVYFDTGRDIYDMRGRVAHESIFNPNDGTYRCASTQQGYSPFTTWTRGLAWILCGYAEQLEFIQALPETAFIAPGVKQKTLDRFLEVALATADFFIERSPVDGVPYWDTGAPGLAHLGDYLSRPADPYNDYEPVDSSAAVIAAQGLIRLGLYLKQSTSSTAGDRYLSAGFTVTQTLFDEPYLSTAPQHEGLLLHSVYHRPNGWEHVPKGQKIACGESSMWGDYHARELALLILQMADGQPHPVFFIR